MALTDAVPGRAVPGLTSPGALAPAAAATVTAGLAAGAGTAPRPTPAAAAAPAAPPAQGTGQAPAAAGAGAVPGVAQPGTGTGTGAAPRPATAIQAAPPAPAGAGTAPRPAGMVTAYPGPAAATGTAPGAAAYTGQARAGLAAGTGTAPQPGVWAYSEVAGFVADSLVLARVIELLGGGVPSTVPQCAGAIFRLGRGYDLGDPQPVVELLMTLMGDGSRPLSWRADNRTITLPVTIVVPPTGNLTADRLTLAAARELLLEAIAADEFTLIWAPDGQNGGLNLVWDCFRAHAAQVSHDVIRARQLVSELAVTFDALPYGRSDTLTSLEFDSPVTGQTPPPAQLVVDDYSTVASTTQATWFSQSPVTALYASSARWSHTITDSNSPLQYTRTLPAAIDLSIYGKLTFLLGLGADPGQYKLWKRNTPVTVTITLTDSSSRTLSFSSRVPCNVSADNNWPLWNPVSLTIPKSATFNFAQVTKYQLTAWNQIHTWLNRLELSATGYLSGLRASYLTSPRRPASARGTTYVLYDITGSAPAPLSVHAQLGYVEQQATTQTFALPGTPGTTNSYTAPTENPGWLSGDNANFDSGTAGTWTGSDGAAANATLAVSATQARSAPNSLRLTPVTGGTNMTAASSLAANITTQGLPCQAGDRIAVRGYARAGTTGRAVTFGAQFFTATGSPISTVTLGSFTDSSAAWNSANGRVTAPATAAFCRMTVTVATPAAGEVHYIDDLYIAYAVQGTVVCTGAGGGGGSTTGRKNAAGGAGGGECAWELNLDLNPGTANSYQIGARGVPQTPVNNVANSGNGTDGGDSWFTGQTTTVRGHGGGHGTGAVQSYGDGAGGARGTGSGNAHHNDGGIGAPGDHTMWAGGGGGGGAGTGTGTDLSAGQNNNNSPGPAGPAGTPPVAGGQGDTGYPGQLNNSGFGGDATAPGGSRPGGGGAGSASDTQTHTGSTGGNGQIWMQVRTYNTASTFPVLLVHKPSARAGLLATPIVSVGGGANPPDGRQYPVPLIDGQQARYNGTFTVLLAAWSWDGTAARNVTVTIRQYTDTGGASVQQQVTASVTPSGVVNGIVNLGEVTLPVTDLPPDNTDSYYVVAVQSDDTADRFLDVLLLDTQASTILVNIPPGQPSYTDYWVDTPETTADLGRVSGSNQGRGTAVSVLGNTIATGGPLRLEPGDNILTIYSPYGLPAIEGDYFGHWYHERLA